MIKENNNKLISNDIKLVFYVLMESFFLYMCVNLELVDVNKYCRKFHYLSKLNILLPQFRGHPYTMSRSGGVGEGYLEERYRIL